MSSSFLDTLANNSISNANLLNENAFNLTNNNDYIVNKPRKQYSISKTREAWSEDDHLKFLEAINLYSRNWKKIQDHIGTKNAIQIRSHAQKYFQKLESKGESQIVPPPRPKKKSLATISNEINATKRTKFNEYSPPVPALQFSNRDLKLNQEVGGPDFSAIYYFISTLFELNISDEAKHAQLCSLSALDQQVAVMLAENLIENISKDSKNLTNDTGKRNCSEDSKC